MQKFISLLLFTLFPFHSILAANEIVSTQYGSVSGVDNGDAVSFLGIPYAKAPEGELRWKAPQEPLAWENILVADKFGADCPQVDFQSKKITGNEDCLTLNIWKPKSISQPLPVLFFIHGGANTLGSSNQRIFGHNLYDGKDLSEKNAIIVTINYRLGALGFLAHAPLKGTDLSSGNFAILDQLQALRFVQNNIQNFGGDPENVTIFGESAGAINSLVLISSPLSQGLFSKAIIQSGFLGDQSLGAANKAAEKWVAETGCISDDTSCLRNLPVEKVLKASESVSQTPLMVESITIDGYVLHQSVLETMRSGHHQKIPVIIGSNKDEMRTLLIGLTPEGTPITEKVYKDFLIAQFGPDKAEKIIAFYPVKNYSSPRQALEEAAGDFAIHCPTRQIVKALEVHQRQIYRYVFSHVSDSPLMWKWGAGHALELPFVFGNLGPTRTPNEHLLSDKIQNYWVQFAMTGNPNYPNAALWPSSTDEAYLNIKSAPVAEARFHHEQCNFWDSL